MKIVSADKLERGLAYGEACFETFRVIHGEIFAWDAHCQRLATGLAEFGITLSDADSERLRDASLKQAEQVGSDVLVRVTVSGGSAEWGLANVSEAPVAYIQVVSAPVRQKMAILMMRNWPFPLKAKPAKFTSDYAETLRVLKGSKNLDLLFEQDQKLIATATANLLIYRGGHWWTPLAERGVLPGVIRGHLIKAGLVHEAECPVSWVSDCEAMALCNSGIFIRPVAAVSEIKKIAVDHPALGELTGALAGNAGVPKELM
ncbi:Branched-chain amino acid aminotransferase/4-amino-4-deoxychorismate lyase [Mariprofundus ferrinatatus]|uniref:Branched-chain amino acid aminotransferase/4-amino-4-deoxychorismate lyase n=1 Tax=Mariprofundus ferrinatatus TaxID=1921087 RepID=A0A2K8L8A9_9PROT|nr:aminotransferase class IV [Mariprofundus ferrinatatus]ATX82101.1 Branched-chain amino acid aminotransferase/4-amino-4-deoxychorismate lyase [Mariprofundus ferrinatatus]